MLRLTFRFLVAVALLSFADTQPAVAEDLGSMEGAYVGELGKIVEDSAPGCKFFTYRLTVQGRIMDTARKISEVEFIDLQVLQMDGSWERAPGFQPAADIKDLDDDWRTYALTGNYSMDYSNGRFREGAYYRFADVNVRARYAWGGLHGQVSITVMTDANDRGWYKCYYGNFLQPAQQATQR